MELEIEAWVAEAPINQRKFRMAVHVILKAIATSDYLKPHMIMKGGMLLGIRYKSSRYTKDIDFSTPELFENFNRDLFRTELDESLVAATDELSYGIDCIVQSFNIQPKEKPGVELTHPSLLITIGYAEKGTRLHQNLLQKRCSDIIKIDYSFNEVVPHPEELSLEGEQLTAYGFTDLIAEKIRSVMQQVVRNRQRRQDIYDLNYLLDSTETLDDEEKLIVLRSIILKSQGRLLEGFVKKNTLDDPAIYDFSKADYLLMADEVEGDLPDFEESYSKVNDFYKSLPWDYL